MSFTLYLAFVGGTNPFPPSECLRLANPFGPLVEIDEPLKMPCLATRSMFERVQQDPDDAPETGNR